MDTVIQSALGILVSLTLGSCFAATPPGVQRSDLLYLQSGGQLTQRAVSETAVGEKPEQLVDAEPGPGATDRPRQLSQAEAVPGLPGDLRFQMMEGWDGQALG